MPYWKNKEEYETWKAAKLKTQEGKDLKVDDSLFRESLKTKESITKTEKVKILRKYNTKEIIGFIGVGLITIGVFLPFVKFPIIGSLNYFRNGEGVGTILLILAFGSLLFIFIDKMKWLWITGGGSALTLFYTLYNFKVRMNEVKGEIDTSLEGNPFKGITDVMIQSVQLEVGVPVLIIGILLIFLSAYLNSK